MVWAVEILLGKEMLGTGHRERERPRYICWGFQWDIILLFGIRGRYVLEEG